MDRIEMLLMLARDAQSDGDDLLREHHRVGATHAARLKELWHMLEEARQILTAEIRRFERYLPTPEPRAATLGQQAGIAPRPVRQVEAKENG